MSSPEPQHAVGIKLDGASAYTIDADQNRALCRSAGVEPDPFGKAHPIYFYIATQVGMRLTIEELCRICDFDIVNGPMLGGTRVSFSSALMIGEPYRVEGEISSITRKSSRKLGLMDIVQYELRLMRQNGERAAAVTNTLILPRAG